jgi:hypothetical protein
MSSTAELQVLRREDVMAAWPDVEPLIRRAVKLWGREDTLDVAGALLKGEYQCFLAVKDGKPIAVAITQLARTRNGMVADIPYVAGEHLTEWIKFTQDVFSWCKAQGCVLVEGIGRPGWERVLPGFDRTGITLRKRL